MTATATATDTEQAEALRASLVDHERELQEAERDLGAAQLDGRSTAAAAKRIETARSAIATATAALAELERRRTADQAQREEIARARGIAEAYPSLAAWFRDVAAMLKLHDAAWEAYSRVTSTRPRPRFAVDEAMAHTTKASIASRKSDDYNLFGSRRGLNEDYFTKLAQRADELAADARETLVKLTDA